MSDQPPEDTNDIAERVKAEVLGAIREDLDGAIKQFEESSASAIDSATTDAAETIEAKVDEVIKQLTETLEGAREQGRAIATSKGAADQVLTQIQGVATNANTALDTVNSYKDEVVSLGERAGELNEEITELQKQVQAAKTKAEEYEKEWTKKYTDLFKTIEDLLPGATGAGLASGFRGEKEKYELKAQVATWVFIGCLVVLVITIAFAPIKVLSGAGGGIVPLTGGDFLQSMIWNLPLVAPAAWGAWWFNRKAHTYDRLGEEYRQKETISNAFVGYTRQLRDLGETEALSDYLSRALREICIPAGRIYDKKLPPGSPLEDHLEKAIEKAIAASKKPDTTGGGE